MAKWRVIAQVGNERCRKFVESSNSPTTAAAAFLADVAAAYGVPSAAVTLIESEQIDASGPGAADAQLYSAIFAASDNAAVVAAVPSLVHAIQCFNVGATPVTVKVYDKATAPTSGDTPKWRGVIPGASGATGSGFILSLPRPIQFTAGVGVRVTTGVADNDTGATTANGGLVNIVFE